MPFVCWTAFTPPPDRCRIMPKSAVCCAEIRDPRSVDSCPARKQGQTARVGGGGGGGRGAAGKLWAYGVVRGGRERRWTARPLLRRLTFSAPETGRSSLEGALSHAHSRVQDGGRHVPSRATHGALGAVRERKRKTAERTQLEEQERTGAVRGTHWKKKGIVRERPFAARAHARQRVRNGTVRERTTAARAEWHCA